MSSAISVTTGADRGSAICNPESQLKPPVSLIIEEIRLCAWQAVVPIPGSPPFIAICPKGMAVMQVILSCVIVETSSCEGLRRDCSARPYSGFAKFHMKWATHQGLAGPIP